MLLSTQLTTAQSSFFAGVQTSINSTTLLNKEDKNAPEGMLDKKNGVQAGYGMQIGYSFKNRITISIEPNYLQYKVMYSGKSDTATAIRSFDANARFQYYQIPLVLTYNQPISEKFSIFAGVGLSYNYMRFYREEFAGITTVLNDPTELLTVSYNYTGKSGYIEAKEVSDGKVDLVFSNPKYINKSYGVLFNLGTRYALSDKWGISMKLNYQKGLNDIENKGIGTETTIHQQSGATHTNTFNFWNETNYARYYYRWPDKNYQRKETYTQAIGLCIGINYFFNGGLRDK